MMRVARVAAQAKLNLFLTVKPPRPDGFHDIISTFQLLDLADDIIVRVDGAGRTLHVAGPRLPDGGLGPTDKNLAYRAGLAYIERARWPNGFSIELTKNIPAGGGLGGGSSDAGAVLRALDALNDHPLGTEVLSAIAATLGSDVSFFVSGSATAFVTGRGDQVGEMPPHPSRDVLLAIPAFGIATADAYRWLDEDRAANLIPVPKFSDLPPSSPSVAEELGSDEWGFVRLASSNDFEFPVERRHTELRRSLVP